MFRLACLTFLLITLSCSAAPQDPVTAARDRQEKFKSVLLEYQQSDRILKPETVNKPAHELNFSFRNRLVLQGLKSRLEENSPIIAEGGGLFRRKQIEVFDGETFRIHYPEGVLPGDNPAGIIFKNSTKGDLSLPQLIVLFLRGESRIAELKPTGKTEILDGSLCVEYQQESRDWVQRCWFDSAKGFLPVRVQSEHKDQISSRETIAYRADATWGWLPVSWKHELNRNGSLAVSKQAEITKFQLNGTVNADDFQIVFAPGTSVQDHSLDRGMIVEADGTMREITLAEMMGSKAGNNQRSWWARNSWYLLLAICALIYGTLCFELIRRHRASGFKSA